MPTYTITDANENGVSDFVTGWADAPGATFDINPLDNGGIRFTGLPFRSYSTSTGLLGAPTTTRHERSVVFGSLTLSLTLAGTGPDELILDLINQVDPGPFVDASNELNLRPFVPSITTFTLGAAGGPYLTTVTLDLLTLTRTLYDSVGWQGKLGFRLRVGGVDILNTISVLSHASGFPPRLLTTEAPLATGLVGAEWAGHGVREDAKTGQYVPRDLALRDGYSRRQWVHPDNYDPPDWETERRRRPRVNEGRTLQERD